MTERRGPWDALRTVLEQQVKTSADAEPPPGTSVTDNFGRPWSRAYDQTDDGAANWTRDDAEADPESWTKVAGNYGPVIVTEAGEETT